jgi:hypothetical protein
MSYWEGRVHNFSGFSMRATSRCKLNDWAKTLKLRKYQNVASVKKKNNFLNGLTIRSLGLRKGRIDPMYALGLYLYFLSQI